MASASIVMEDLWRYQHIDLDAVIDSCCRANVEVLNIQYHTGFLRESFLLPLAHTCLAAGIGVLIALHDPKNVSDHTLVELSRIGVRLVVHNEAEQRRFRGVGVEDIGYVPLGVLDVPDEDVASARSRLALPGAPVIGTFGFLRPHKGLLELIEAMKLLRDLYPDLVLHALASAHPSKEGQQYQRKCEARIAELGLTDHVLLDTRFRDIEQVIRDLHACDAIVLPYHASKEGASASANVALAARRPVITSRAEIFQSTRRATYQVEGITPPTLAAGVATALSSPLLLTSLKAQSERHVASTSWATVAESIAQLAFPVDQSEVITVSVPSGAGSWAGDGRHRNTVGGVASLAASDPAGPTLRADSFRFKRRADPRKEPHI
jgi:glycosyltransferase involved in cell wall biosynthesis